MKMQLLQGPGYFRCSIFFSALAVLYLITSELPFNSAKQCTKLQSEVRRNTSLITVSCIQRFETSCGTFMSFDYCTYYRKGMCEKQLNYTYNWYYATQVCCPGYYKTANGSCIAPKDAAELPTHLQTDEIKSIAQKHQKTEDVKLSSGAYAGIAAGGVALLCCVGILILVLYRRNREKPPAEVTAVEMEQRVGLKSDPAPENS